MLRNSMALLAVMASLVLSAGGASAAGPSAGALPPHGQRAVCAVPAAGARCFAVVVTTPDGAAPLATSTYSNGYQPSDLWSAYSLPGTAPAGHGTGPTVAIVDAYDNPNAHADLVAYRSQFGLAPLCDTVGATVKCVNFTKVNQSGGSTPPAGNTGWGQEIDLDIDMVSAACPGCNILLVEADSNYFSDLGTAVNYAASAGAVAISNSYGAREFNGESSYGSYYNHPHIAVTASTGDSGYGAQFPAAVGTVVAVGGTTLARNASNPTSAVRTVGSTTWSETVWSGTGSGCSRYYDRESWQNAVITSGTCSKRVIGDVSAVADPNTGVAVYDSYGSTAGRNWYVFGGTSVSSPIIASLYAAAGFAQANPAQLTYSVPTGLWDVVAGSNGNCVRGGKRSTAGGNAYLCTGQVGYDGPTGMGTPKGLSAF